MEIKIVKKVLKENENLAKEVRHGLRKRHQSMFNFMSSPGAGKTTLLEKLIAALQQRGKNIGVIEGDITTTRDAERLQPLNIPIAQINTEPFGGDCHLGANVILGAMDLIKDADIDMVFIENVGNLVCPAEFDTGADVNIVLLSVTEGEDKPIKYPLMFQRSQAALINKIDLSGAADADIELFRKYMNQVNGHLSIFETSGKTSQGIPELTNYIIERHDALYS
jgi:hydrogenase nickel incorporation protein HypB